MYFINLFVFVLFLIGQTSVKVFGQTDTDIKAINQIIVDQAGAWNSKDIDLFIKNYDEKVDWTNAFGDRIKGKSNLKALIQEIFSLNFVMKGDSENQYNDIVFLTPDIAMVRSKTIVKGQEWGNGVLMEDRHNHHLRIFQKKGMEWKVISHLISQAWTKK